MYLKYSLGFLIAALVQAGTIALTEYTGISSLNVDITFSQLLIHIIAGQIAGYALLFTMRKAAFVGNGNTWVVGIVWGILVWAVIIPFNVAQGKLNAPWTQDTATLLSSITAFVFYGLIATYTIKRYGYEKSDLLMN